MSVDTTQAESRLSRLLGTADGRDLYSYVCPEGLHSRYRARLVQKNVDGRDLYAVVPCLPRSSSRRTLKVGTCTSSKTRVVKT
jgi:hypothetical protein